MNELLIGGVLSGLDNTMPAFITKKVLFYFPTSLSLSTNIS